MKKIYFILLGIIFIIPSIVMANSIDNINMDIYISNDGTAHITEVWKANLDSGTEGYKPYYNLGNSVISNFKVKLNDKEFTFIDNYNINDSFEKKKYTNGFNYINNGIELCFGISEYGKNTYYLEYDISNFVVNTSDGYQMVYWTLFPYDYNPSPDNVYIKIHSDFKYSDTLDVWGYGKYGAPCYVYDGVIEMSSEGTVYNSEYMTILVKFPSDTFNTNITFDKTFDEYLDMANDGAEVYKNNDNNNSFDVFLSIFSIIFSFGLPIIIIIITYLIIKKNGYGYKNNKVINKKNTNFYREIPCNKDIYYANTLTNLNKNIFNSYKETNIFGAIILKWVKEEKIKFITSTSGIFNKETSSIDLTLNPSFDNHLEKELFDIMYTASKDGILETKELEKWCKNNYTKFFDLFNRINIVEIEKLKNNNHIYKRINKDECKYKNVMDDTIYEDSSKLYGLKLYLDEFSSINTKEVMEVHLWDEYLMFAYVFGIADKVAKQLKNLYPEVLVNNNIDFDTLLYINYISTRSVSAASTAKSRAESYSSGGGGFSSGGGGGGSSGGGGGGGGFR
ncbi:MAG: DUF2207 family protein [Bacilli bacterium]